MDRRTFLKITGLGSAAVATGCTSNPEKNLFTLVKAPDDMVTGKAAWYASTCRECPAGCGILAKNREGRVIKLEGNPLNPVNRGKLCARGQSALQGLYNPDRITTPLRKSDSGLKPITFSEAEALILQRLEQAGAKGEDSVALVTEVTGDTLLGVFRYVLSHFNSTSLHTFEPFAFESLKYAHEQVFGSPQLPGYRLDRADMLISFGADFLETWLSPVEYARKFKAMHSVEKGKKGFFAHVGPYQSLTAANADRWLACKPGSELSVVLLLLKDVMTGSKAQALSSPFREGIEKLTDGYSLESVSNASDIPAEALKHLVKRFRNSKRPLILGSCTASQGSADTALDLAVVILNTVCDPSLDLIDFDQRHRVEIAHSRASMEAFWERSLTVPPEVLMLHNVNPLYSTPKGSKAAKVLGGNDTFAVSFSCFMDETTAAADLIVPIQHPLESWDIYESKQATKAFLQPVLGKINQVPAVGDVFLKLVPPGRRPSEDYRKYLIQSTVDQGLISSETDWIKLMRDGGSFVADRQASKPVATLDAQLAATLALRINAVPPADTTVANLYLAPSLHYLDGRGANRPWLLETPDPLSQVAWQTLAMVHPDVMADNGWRDGDRVAIQNQNGELQLPVVANGGVHPKAMVIPLGQGHTHFGRYAKAQGVNPVALMGAGTVSSSGAPVYRVAVESILRVGNQETLAAVSGSRDQFDRKIALTATLEETAEAAEDGKGLTMDDFPLTMPLPEGYDHHRDLYPAHLHDTYRWGMVVDLDRCIGCTACVAACYAENNIGIAGQDQISRGREMAWMSIQRYEDQDDPAQSIFLPMMCQHCDNAPCEAVCPVYAPHHSKEGLNNQIYNRCIGTRFCAQNCPYKVRRFNWYEWKWPEPLQMQLNPNVTVRTKGVMEKCSFCIQRIKETRGVAKNEKRDIRDGEVIPACVQTCPTGALYFGNFMDPESTVRKLVNDSRAYQVLGYLNAKPAVIYLKKVTQTM